MLKELLRYLTQPTNFVWRKLRFRGVPRVAEKPMAELGKMRTVDLTFCVFAYGHGPPQGKPWEVPPPSTSSLQHLPVLVPCAVPPPLLPSAPSAADQACSMLTPGPSYPLCVSVPDHANSHSSLSLGLCGSLVYIMCLRTRVVTLPLLCRPFSARSFGTRQVDSDSGPTT